VAPLHERAGDVFGAVSKTVDGRKVVRGFETLPLRFGGLVEPNPPQTRAIGLGATV